MTANLRARPDELTVLIVPTVARVLDVTTGEAWTAADVRRAFGVSPAHIARLEAIMGAEPGQRPIVRIPHLSRHREAVAAALESGQLAHQASVPSSIRTAIVAKARELDEREQLTRGGPVADDTARVALQARLAPHASTTTVRSASPQTAYIVADVDRASDPMQLREAAVLVDGTFARARGNVAALRLLKEVHGAQPLQWFAPQGLDLLGVLVDAGAPVPLKVVDPAHALFVLDPDSPPALEDVCRSAAAFPREVARWFGDQKRELETPHGFASQMMMLPAVDRELHAALARATVDTLMEYDIASTLPVLAHMERRGAWVQPPAGFLTWEHFGDHVQDEIEHHENLFLPFVGSADPYAPSPAEAVRAFRGQVVLVRQEEEACKTTEHELDRMAASGFVPAAALRRARRLVSMLNDWVRPLRAGNISRVRGRMTLTRTGRWSAKQYPLHSLPKSGIEGTLLRSAMLPPRGYEVVVADYSAFEARILAGLTDDPQLTGVVHLPAFHAVLAPRAATSTGRVLSKDQWKAALYGIAYGEGRNGFIGDHTEMSVGDAGDTFDAVAKLLAVTMKYRDKFRKRFQPGATQSVTLGGWRRRARKWTSGFNTVIQGQAADIFRYVLRTLHRELAPFGAFLLHQAHDEVFVASPPAMTPQVVALVKRVMEQDVVQHTRLMQARVPLFAEVSVRTSWAK